MKIAAAALNQTPIAWSHNLTNIQNTIKEAKQDNIDLICLPELCITGYGCEDLFLTDWIYEKSLDQLKKIIPETEEICVIIGLPILFKSQRYNCAAIIKKQELIAIIPKQNLAIDGVHYESRWFKEWEAKKETTISIEGKLVPFGDIIFEVKNKKIGLEICEDAWRESRPADYHYERSVDIICNPSASPFALKKTHLRQNLVKASSQKYDCTYVYANILGNESGRLIFDGELIIAKEGNLVCTNERFSFKDRATEDLIINSPPTTSRIKPINIHNKFILIIF